MWWLITLTSISILTYLASYGYESWLNDWKIQDQYFIFDDEDWEWILAELYDVNYPNDISIFHFSDVIPNIDILKPLTNPILLGVDTRAIPDPEWIENLKDIMINRLNLENRHFTGGMDSDTYASFTNMIDNICFFISKGKDINFILEGYTLNGQPWYEWAPQNKDLFKIITSLIDESAKLNNSTLGKVNEIVETVMFTEPYTYTPVTSPTISESVASFDSDSTVKAQNTSVGSYRDLYPNRVVYAHISPVYSNSSVTSPQLPELNFPKLDTDLTPTITDNLPSAQALFTPLPTSPALTSPEIVNLTPNTIINDLIGNTNNSMIRGTMEVVNGITDITLSDLNSEE
jgi:hypothetical protein